MSQTDNKFQSLEAKIRTVLETRNTGTEARVKLPNVGRQDSDKPTSNNSVLAKTSSIKTKIVDEGESSMLKDNKNFNLSTDLIDATRQIIEKKDTEDKAKKTDAGDMTGGKTKIELEPKTDDSTQDENLETTKSKKIRQTLNKEIGQVGAAGVKEEVEQVDELSRATLGSYIKKATDPARGDWQPLKRREGIAKAVDKLTKEGVENELNDDELDILDLIAFELEDLDKVELDEARGRPSLPRDKSGKIIRDPAAIAAHRTSQSTSNDESPHIVDQLRKVITTNGKQHVTFKSGETHPISVNHAKAALIKHRDAGKPVDKAKVAGHMWASHDSFKSALAGEKAPESAIKRASGRGSVSLPPLKSSTKSHEPAMTPDTIKRSAAAFAAYRKEKNK